MIAIMNTIRPMMALLRTSPPHVAPMICLLTSLPGMLYLSEMTFWTRLTSLTGRLSVVTRQRGPASWTMTWWTPASSTVDRTSWMEDDGGLAKLKTEPPLNSTPRFRPWKTRPTMEISRSTPDRLDQSL